MSLSAKDGHIQPGQCLANKRLACWLQLDPCFLRILPGLPGDMAGRAGSPSSARACAQQRVAIPGKPEDLVSDASHQPGFPVPSLCLPTPCLPGLGLIDGQAQIPNPTAAGPNCSTLLERDSKRLRLKSQCWLVLTVSLTQP